MKTLTALLIFLIISVSVSAQEKTYNLDEIVVSSARTPITFNNLSRSVKLISADEIKEFPVNNVIDLLKYVSGVDLRARGTEGAQADIAIRGGTFEQTLVLIDGVKITDPQTGHHNLNLPVSIDNIERIEILKGQGTRIFGANAFSGAVNIITKIERLNSFSGSLLGGQHGLFEYNLSGSLSSGILANNVSYSKKKTDGYRHNTNYDMQNFSIRQNYSLGQNKINLLLGYIDKSFGANSFYSERFPNQFERTITRIANISAEIPVSGLIFSPKVFYRNSLDDFHLDYMRQNWNHNTHRTESFGSEIQTSLSSLLGVTYFGGEFGRDEIRSSNLGTHIRSKAGFYAEQKFSPINDFSISAGLFAYNYSSIGWKFWPGFDFSFNFSNEFKLFASIGKAFRIPTFTELYYVSPANMGNPNLLYEQTTNYEAGFSYYHNYFVSSTSVFLKEGTNLIDWVRAEPTQPWRVENVSNLTTAGAEINLELATEKLCSEFPISSIGVSYVYLTSNRSAGSFVSKYLLDHLRHQLIIGITNKQPLSIKQNWSLRYEERENVTSHFIVDTQLSVRIQMFDLFVRATNIFNTSYFDIPGVILPGRWISAGIKFRIESPPLLLEY